MLDKVLLVTTISIDTIGKHGERVCRAVLISPELEALYCSDAFDTPKRVCTAVSIGPDDIDIETVDQIFSPQVSLETEGRLGRGEFVLDLDGLIEEHLSVRVGVPYVLSCPEGDKLLELERIGKLSVPGMESVGYCL